jgi:hypothetical protein
MAKGKGMVNKIRKKNGVGRTNA